MSGLLLPPGAPARRDRTPLDDVRLADGRLLKRFGTVLEAEIAPGVIQRQAAWQCAAISLRVIVSDEQTPHGLLMHVSMSHPHHLPSWETVRLVRDAFFGDDIDVMLLLPQRADYVNLHPFVLHLWQTPTTWGLR